MESVPYKTDSLDWCENVDSIGQFCRLPTYILRAAANTSVSSGLSQAMHTELATVFARYESNRGL